MSNNPNFIDYLNFIYKYKKIMDDVCPEIVGELNRECKNKGSPFKLDHTPMNYSDCDTTKEREFFCGYYIKFSNEEDSYIYIGLDWNILRLYINQTESSNEITDEKHKEYFFSVAISKEVIKKKLKKPETAPWPDNGGWQFFIINRSLWSQLLLSSEISEYKYAKEKVIDEIVEIIKTNHSYF